MEAEEKYLETGSNPYYLNTNNTAKEFSINENTNPQFGLLDTLTKFVIIENKYLIETSEFEQILSSEKNTTPNSGFNKLEF